MHRWRCGSASDYATQNAVSALVSAKSIEPIVPGERRKGDLISDRSGMKSVERKTCRGVQKAVLRHVPNLHNAGVVVLLSAKSYANTKMKGPVDLAPPSIG